MPTIQAGQSATVQLMEGETVTVTPVRQAQVSTRGVSGSPLADPRTISAATTFGPYTEAGVLVIGAVGDSVAYTNSSPVSGDGISSSQAISGSVSGSAHGEIRTLLDGPAIGQRVRWWRPTTAAGFWGYDISPSDRFTG